MFSTNIQQNKNTEINIASNILNTCNNIISQISTLETTNNSNATYINNIINNANVPITTLNTIQTQITNLTNTETTITNNLNRISAYEFQIFSYTNVYNNWYNSSSPHLLGYISNKGVLKKIYFFANIYSWYTCIATQTYFRILVKNESTNVIIYDKSININKSPDMTIEILDDVNVNVDKNCSVNFAIAGSYYVTCSVESSNLQVQLNVDSY